MRRDNNDHIMTDIEQKKFRKRVLKEALVEIPKAFRPEVGSQITTSMLRNAVDEAVEHLTVFDAVMALRYGHRFCEKCGECCRRSNPINIDYQDVFNLARFLGVTPSAVIANYTIEHANGTFSLKAEPCVFLIGNDCSVYAARPFVCRQFPVTMVGGFGALLNYTYCSFVKNLLIEKAKCFVIGYLVEKKAPEAKAEIEALRASLKEAGKDIPKVFVSQLSLANDFINFSASNAPEKKDRSPKR